jgi:hypothetical protein
MRRVALGLLAIAVGSICYPTLVDAGPFAHRRGCCQPSCAPSNPCSDCNQCYLYLCTAQGHFSKFPHAFHSFNDAYVAGQLYKGPDCKPLRYVTCTANTLSQPCDHTFTVCGCPEPGRDSYGGTIEYDLYYCLSGVWTYEGTFATQQAASQYATGPANQGGGYQANQLVLCNGQPVGPGFTICPIPNSFNGATCLDMTKP